MLKIFKTTFLPNFLNFFFVWRLDGRECNASTLADVHVWLLFFVDDLVLTSKSEVGLQQ